jgi:general secretion pathway protein N
MRSAFCLAVALLASAAVDAAPRNPLDAVRLEDLAATRQRPLFTPSRRPPPPAARVDPSPAVELTPDVVRAAPPPPFDLVGAVVGENARYALLRQRTTNKVARLRPGDVAEGWRVTAIGIRSVVLERDGRSDSLALTSTPSTAPATPAAQIAEEPSDDAARSPPAIGLRPSTPKAHDD